MCFAHEECWPGTSFVQCLWFWYKGDIGLIRWAEEDSFLLHSLKAMWMVLLFLLKGLTELSEASGPAISFAGRFSHEVNLRSRHEALHILYLFFIFFIFSIYSSYSSYSLFILHILHIICLFFIFSIYSSYSSYSLFIPASVVCLASVFTCSTLWDILAWSCSQYLLAL